MLYVLVNNDYHLLALRRHGLAALGGSEGVTLIAVPHALSSALDTGEFRAVHRFSTPLGRSRIPFAFFKYAAAALAVRRALRPGPQDVLLFFTEMEWLNQIVVQHFRGCGARIVMLEDGGFATYIPMSLSDSEPLSLRERCVQTAYRWLPGLGRSRLFKLNGVLFPRLPDDMIDVIALYKDVSLHRNVPICRVAKPPQKSYAIRRSAVIFLNQDMYFDYQTEEGYLAGLRRLLMALRNGFETVYFKFHPREPEEWKRRIRVLLLQEFPSIELIERSGPIEQMILEYRPEALASYFSAALLNTEYDGIEPLYLYHLLDDLRGQPVFVQATHLLNGWGYNFAASEKEVRSGYRSGIMSGDAMPGIDLQQLLVTGT